MTSQKLCGLVDELAKSSQRDLVLKLGHPLAWPGRCAYGLPLPLLTRQVVQGNNLSEDIQDNGAPL